MAAGFRHSLSKITSYLITVFIRYSIKLVEDIWQVFLGDSYPVIRNGYFMIVSVNFYLDSGIRIFHRVIKEIGDDIAKVQGIS